MTLAFGIRLGVVLGLVAVSLAAPYVVEYVFARRK